MTAAKKTAADFEEIIQRGTQHHEIDPAVGCYSRLIGRRQKAQELANQLLGRRTASGSGINNAPRKPGTGPSLASRIGVAKVW
jgi:hypothetical protein